MNRPVLGRLLDRLYDGGYGPGTEERASKGRPFNVAGWIGAIDDRRCHRKSGDENRIREAVLLGVVSPVARCSVDVAFNEEGVGFDD